MTMLFSGLRAWTIQRLTAIYVLLFLLYALASIALRPPSSYVQWHAWVIDVRPGLMLFFAALLVHAWVGLRDVVLDYAKPAPVRAAALGALALGLAALGAWVLQILIVA